MEETINNEEVVDNTADIAAEKGEETPAEDVKEEVPETPKEQTYTKAQMEDRIERRLKRFKEKEEAKYEPLLETLKAGMGASSLEEVTEKAKEFYKEQGIEIPKSKANKYSAEDEQILATYEANKIVEMGLDEVEDTISDYEEKGVDNLSSREKSVYQSLVEIRNAGAKRKELKELGATDEELDSDEFKKFAAMFTNETPAKTVYSMYKEQHREPVTPIGDMSSSSQEYEIKKYYSPADYDKLTTEQKNNPEIMKAVENSMFGITGKKWA